MSVQSEIDRLTAAKNSIAASLTAMGIEPPENTTMDQYAAQLAAIAASAPWLPLSGGVLEDRAVIKWGFEDTPAAIGADLVIGQMVISAPYHNQENVPMIVSNNALIRGIISPRADNDVANKQYVDAAKPKATLLTLPAASWDATAKTQTVSVPGILADESKQLIQPMPAAASLDAYTAAGIMCVSQAANSLTFKAQTVPTADIQVYVTVQEVGG